LDLIDQEKLRKKDEILIQEEIKMANNKISEGLKAYWASGAAASRRAKDNAAAKAKSVGSAVKSAADRNKDGAVNRADIKAGVAQAGAAVGAAIREGRARMQGRSSRNNTMRANDGPQATANQIRAGRARDGVRRAREAVAGTVSRATSAVTSRTSNPMPLNNSSSSMGSRLSRTAGRARDAVVNSRAGRDLAAAAKNVPEAIKSSQLANKIREVKGNISNSRAGSRSRNRRGNT